MDDVIAATEQRAEPGDRITQAEILVWTADRIECVFAIGDDQPATLLSMNHPGVFSVGSGSSLERSQVQPVVELFTAGSGHRKAASRLVNSDAGITLRYASHTVLEQDGWSILRLVQVDPSTGTEVVAVFRAAPVVAAFTVQVEVANRSEFEGRMLVLEAVAVAGAFAGVQSIDVDDIDILSGRSDWLAEGRWQRQNLRDAGLAELDLAIHASDPRGAIVHVSTGSWSTESALPIGALIDRRSGTTWMWQVETNGAWRWEVGERRSGAYVALSGPTARDHQWVRPLLPGESFTTVPVTLAFSPDGLESAVAEMNEYRRAARRPHEDNARLPVVFNDYMNTLMGDPTTEKLLPLIDAAHDVGAEVFVIDAGWYDESGDWWATVGEWIPSARRFPNGFGQVIDHIRELGMRPGLWLEPEVVGVNSAIADSLPREAFLQQRGIRIREHERYHLDLRHPAAREHLDRVIDRLVADFGIGYFKLDYNINAGPGTDVDSFSVGDGLLEHNRAHLEWLDGVLDRHPDLVLENCASGAMRMDFAMLSRLQLQSTSDQQDPILYPPIAAASAIAMLPEQAANWAYPQPGMTDEEAAFTLCTAMLGRFYLSGYIKRMSMSERELVSEAVAAHAALSADVVRSHAVWPLGLPEWNARWIAFGLQTENRVYVTTWRRPGSARSARLSFPHFIGRDVRVEAIFPARLEAWQFAWDEETGELTVMAGEPQTAARTFLVIGSSR